MISVPQLLYDLRQEMGTFFSTESFNTTTLLKTINSWVRKLCQAWDWKFNDYVISITTNWTDEEYTIPKFYKIYALKVWWTSGEYTPVSFEDYFTSQDPATQKMIWFKQEKMYTTLALTISLIYRWMPTRLTSLEWNIDLPEDAYDALLSACAYYWFLQSKQYPRADKRKADFETDVKRLKTMETDTFPRVSTRMGAVYSHNAR